VVSNVQAIWRTKMSRLRVGASLWLEGESTRTARQRRYPSLDHAIDVDVAIVGGGTSGATVAWAFASAGVRVAVVEAAFVGRGSTAASTALLMQEPDEDFQELERRYGRAAATRIWELGRLATRDFVATLGDLGIECDLERRDSLYYARSFEDARRLAHELRRRRAAGFDGEWIDAATLRRQMGIAGAAAIRTSGNAQLDPYRACLGLLGAAASSGAQIFERSPVRRIAAAPDGVRVLTTGGEIRAARVVVATGYATPEFAPLLGRFTMKHTYVLATKPADARMRQKLRLDGVMLWDTARPYHYARWTRDHRLLIGGADRPRVADGERPRALAEGARRLREHFERLLPPLAALGFERQWEGLFATTPDGLPYIGPHRRYPRHLFALGYGGNGMTFGFLAGRLLLEWHRGIQSPDHELFSFERHRTAAARLAGASESVAG
jgi:glycine/D-amino acid oxidase-like deaminating enzyme